MAVAAASVAAQTDTLIPPSAYAARRAQLAAQVMPAVVLVPGRHLVGQHELPRQDANFWYLTGVESPYSVLVMAPDRRPGAAPGAVRTVLFLPDSFEFAGAQFPMLDSSFRRASWNIPRHRLAPGAEATRLTGIAETYPLRELAARVRELAGDTPVLYAPLGADSLYAPPGVARVLPLEQQLARTLVDLVPARDRRDVTPLIRTQRLIKDAYEIAALREAARVSAESFVTL
ncbi:MAG: aminopeptidase P N-terminal domain-containing protein, partial [Gemmatimonadetes bacterium]|nr:aminopeptidase P N-terminal domain-containing protein [Gemmatimonadota bacterium]